MSVLDRIVARVAERLADTIREVPPARIRSDAEAAPARPSFRDAVEREGTTLIAETKRESPSRGTLREPYDPVWLAREYERAGARAVSVLTEPDFFGGSPLHLRAVREACELPLLRKDFLLDPYQVWEARSWGASAVLLIAAVLEDARLRDMLALAAEVGMDALVEVHTDAEADRAGEAGAGLVGVNNRDLTTFETDRGTTARIAGRLGRTARIVAESGIFTREHVLEVERAGASAVLVGEALVTAKNPGEKVAELVGREGGAS